MNNFMHIAIAHVSLYHNTSFVVSETKWACLELVRSFCRFGISTNSIIANLEAIANPTYKK